MNVFSAMEIVSSGLGAQRLRMNTIASNLANAQTTQTEEGGPYKRIDPVFRAVSVADRFQEMAQQAGARETYLVEVPTIRQDNSPPQKIYDPTHPDADEQGFVSMPNVQVMEEMVNMITASRAYDAGVTAMKSLKSMARSAISIGS